MTDDVQINYNGNPFDPEEFSRDINKKAMMMKAVQLKKKIKSLLAEDEIKQVSIEIVDNEEGTGVRVVGPSSLVKKATGQFS